MDISFSGRLWLFAINSFLKGFVSATNWTFPNVHSVPMRSMNLLYLYSFHIEVPDAGVEHSFMAEAIRFLLSIVIVGPQFCGKGIMTDYNRCLTVRLTRGNTFVSNSFKSQSVVSRPRNKNEDITLTAPSVNFGWARLNERRWFSHHLTDLAR
jgi:hypothetical protein